MENFDEVVKEGTHVITFSAQWCGPCKALAPTLDEVKEELKDKPVSFHKVDVDENSELAQKYEVRGIPTMVKIVDGEVRHTLVGNQPKSEILKMVNG